jgi:hypothetical protein
MMRRAHVILVALTCLAGVASAEPPSEIERGLEWLASRQRDSGAFGDDDRDLTPTALATLALLSAGHEPDLGRHGLVLRRAVDFLQSQLTRDATDPRQRAILLLALLESVAVEPDAGRRERQVESLRPLANAIARDADAPDADDWTRLAADACRSAGLLSGSPSTAPVLDESARRRLFDDIAERPEKDGGWSAGRDGEKTSRVVTTSLALLRLTLPARHLPSMGP